MENKICAIVVTYNRLQLLKKCIDAINKQTLSCDLFVVNNHSTDETDKYLEEHHINHFYTDKNEGGAGGFNIGIRKAIDFNYKYLWLMDDDCIPKEDALEKLFNAGKLLDDNFGFLSSRVLWTDCSDHKMNEIQQKKRYVDSVYKINQGTFVSVLIKSDVIREVGLPIKDFFIWGDDIEYTRRISIRYGYPCYYVENSIVIHETKSNNGSKIAYDEISNINRYFYAYRNESFLYRLEGVKGRFYYYSKCIYNTLRIILFSKDHKIKRLKVLYKGIKEGLLFDPKVEKL